MDVVLVSSEVAPYSKTGGLGDAVGALARALARRGHQVWTVSPRYRGVAPDARFTGHVVRVPVGQWEHRAGLHTLDEFHPRGAPPPGPPEFLTTPSQGGCGVTHVFVDNGMYDRDGLYGDTQGTYGDNHIRYALLCQAALHAGRRLAGPEPVFHCHDWHAALLPVYLKAYWRPVGLHERAGTVLTLHNPAHQGRLLGERFVDLELPARWMTPWGVEYHGDVGILKGGILHADQLTTVSPTFAREIVTPGGGFGLEPVLGLRAVDLTGVLNGIDPDEWNPATDRHLPAPFDREDLAGKAVCKATLQAELGLPVDPDAPLVGTVTRLDPQKGVELLLESVPWLASKGAQVVVLGSAAAPHRVFEQRLRELEWQHKDHVRAWIGYSEAVAHRIVAGADVFVMPSLFEPCGLTQMYAMRYGTPPVVRRTGGLADSVEECDPFAAEGTGFFFERPTGQALRDALWRALDLFRRDPEAFAALRRRGMARDFSWDRVAPAYEQVYERARTVRSA